TARIAAVRRGDLDLLAASKPRAVMGVLLTTAGTIAQFRRPTPWPRAHQCRAWDGWRLSDRRLWLSLAGRSGHWGDGEPEVAEFGAVGDEVDFGDLAVCDGAAKDAQRLVPGAVEGSGAAVDGGGDRVGEEARRGTQDVAGDRVCAGDFEGCYRAGLGL